MTATMDKSQISPEEFQKFAADENRAIVGYISALEDPSVIYFGRHPNNCPTVPIPRDLVAWIEIGQKHTCRSQNGVSLMWFARLLLRPGETPLERTLERLLAEFMARPGITEPGKARGRCRSKSGHLTNDCPECGAWGCCCRYYDDRLETIVWECRTENDCGLLGGDCIGCDDWCGD